MSATSPSSLGVHVANLWRKILNLGPYATEQLILELVATSSATLPLLQRYAELPPEICRAYGTATPRIWLLKD